MCLKEYCFPDCWKVSYVVPVFKIVGEKFAAKIYCPLSLLSVFSKVLKNLYIIGLIITSRKVAVDFHYDFRSSQSSADLLTGVSD